jgi:hypothetical protein
MGSIKDVSQQVSAVAAGLVAMDVLDTTQKYSRGELVAGVFMLAYILAHQLQLDTASLMNQAQRRFYDLQKTDRVEGAAIQAYADAELI